MAGGFHQKTYLKETSMLEDEIRRLVTRPNYWEITFEYRSYGEMFVACTIRRPGKKLEVRSLAANTRKAFDKATELVFKLAALETTHSIEIPPLNKQPNENGYYREMITPNTEIEFKNIKGQFAVTALREKDGEWYVQEKPFDVPWHYKKAHDTSNLFPYPELEKIDTSNLLPGDELYQWDTIANLAGSAGFAVVRAGKVIKTMTIAIG